MSDAKEQAYRGCAHSLRKAYLIENSHVILRATYVTDVNSISEILGYCSPHFSIFKML